MSKTLATMITEAGARLNDEQHARIDKLTLRAWINEGTREIARRTECLFGTSTITTVVGTAGYSVPADVVRIDSVQYELNGQTTYLEYQERIVAQRMWGTNQAAQSAWPDYFTTWGQPGTATMTLTLFPVPSQIATLRLFYYRLPVELSTSGSTDSSNIDVPNGWEDPVLDWVEAKAYRRDRDSNNFQIANAAFTERLIALKETADNNYNTAARQFVPDDNMLYPDGWY